MPCSCTILDDGIHILFKHLLPGVRRKNGATMKDDLISRLSELRCQYNCFDENERDAYHTLSEAIKVLSDVPDTNVGDTISRQAAIDALGERPMVWTSDDDYALGERNQYDADRLAVETVPSADAVEVVRCKDCKYYYYADNRIPSERGWVCANDGCYASQNDYCSWGERNDV